MLYRLLFSVVLNNVKVLPKLHLLKGKYNLFPALIFVKKKNQLQMWNLYHCFHSTPQPLYNTTVGVQTNFRVSYPNHVILRVKCIGYTEKCV